MPSEVKVYHHQQPTDGGSPSPIENHLASSYSLADLVRSTATVSVDKNSNYVPTTIDSVYAGNNVDDDFIDEVGEAEDDKYSVEMEGENSTSGTGTDIFSPYCGPDGDDYAALEPLPQDLYVQSLLETEIEVLMPYDLRLGPDVAGEFYVSYYNSGAGTEEVAELETETEEEPLFTTTSTLAEDAEPEEEANPQSQGDLESRLGFRKAA